jgi:protein transport protein SEC61 subunit gamma-like protein
MTEEPRTEKPKTLERLKAKFQQYRRTIEVCRKPDREEYISSSKITAAGIGLIGAIGFAIYIIYVLVSGAI